MNRMFRILVPVVLLVALVAVAGCKKKQPLPPAEAAPAVAAPAPTAQITATPTVVSAGDQVQLSWRTTDAASVSIDGIGDVPTSGVRAVFHPSAMAHSSRRDSSSTGNPRLMVRCAHCVKRSVQAGWAGPSVSGTRRQSPARAAVNW